jgi:hypothetical protein
MRRAAADLLVCLAIQILVLAGIGGAAHSATMASAERYALCGTGGTIAAPDGEVARHCLDCVAAVAEAATRSMMAGPDRELIPAEPARTIRRVEASARSGALRIRAPPARPETEI